MVVTTFSISSSVAIENSAPARLLSFKESFFIIVIFTEASSFFVSFSKIASVARISFESFPPSNDV